MKENRLGKTDLLVSHLSCGALFVSAYGGTPFEEGKMAVRRALELGMNYIDTAPGYANSEEILGQYLEGVEQPYYLSTKLGGRPTPFDPRNKDQLFFSFEESLRQLKRPAVDILYIHEPDRPGQWNWFEEWDTFHGPVTEVLEELKQRGLVRYTGLAGTTVYEMARIVEKANYDVLLTAFNYSLLFREAADTLIPAARQKGMGIVAGTPMQQGWFSRVHDDVIAHPPAWMAPRRVEQLRRLYQLVAECGIPLPEMALRFMLSNPDIDTVLTGVSSAQEADLNVAAMEKGALPGDVLAQIDEIAAMLPYRPWEEPSKIKKRKGYIGAGPLR
ncbi:MAG: aldo/keto reductase [Chloroflexi bacterium]|nr:aldo/keto reductase [Chloroflexota bacterium]